MRRVDRCLNCGDQRELVSHGLCAKCLMQHRRAAERQGELGWLAGPDRSQNRSQRELNRARVNFARMLALLDDTPTCSMILSGETYLRMKADLIAGINSINALQKLTVHSESKLTVNSNDPQSEPNKPENVVEFTVIPVTELTVNSIEPDQDDNPEPEDFDGPF